RVDGGAGAAQECRRRVRRQAQDGRADDGDRGALALRAADPGGLDTAGWQRRVVDRGDPHTLVDVPLPPARGAALARLPGLNLSPPRPRRPIACRRSVRRTRRCSLRGWGGCSRTPWISSQPRSRRNLTCSGVSTPSAITLRRRLWAIAITAETIAASSGS